MMALLITSGAVAEMTPVTANANANELNVNANANELNVYADANADANG